MSNRKDIKMSELLNIWYPKRTIFLHSTEEEIFEVYANSKNKAQTCKKLTEIVKTAKTDAEILEVIKKL